MTGARMLSTSLFALVAVVNLLPVAGASSSARLEALYGVAIGDANLEILLRHRALLFAGVGGLLAAAAFHAPLRPAALAVGLASMLSFVAIAWLVGGANPALRRVAAVDLAASAALVVAVVLDRFAKPA